MSTVSNNVYAQAAMFRSAEFAAHTKGQKDTLKLDVNKLLGAMNMTHEEGTSRLFGRLSEKMDRAKRLLGQLDDFLAEVNAFLGRSDLSDEQRTAFLRRFLGTAIKPDEADDIDHDASGEKLTGALSTLIAAAVSGDIGALNEMLTEWNTIDELDLTAMINNATKDMAEWRDNYGVSHVPDTFADYLQKQHADARKFFDEIASLPPREKLARVRERQADITEAIGART